MPHEYPRAAAYQQRCFTHLKLVVVVQADQNIVLPSRVVAGESSFLFGVWGGIYIILFYGLVRGTFCGRVGSLQVSMANAIIRHSSSFHYSRFFPKAEDT